MEFALDLGFRQPVVVTNDAPEISSDGGALLLGQMDDALGMSAMIAGCLEDRREPTRVSHSHQEQVRQRVLMIAQGYADCNDARQLRLDPVLKLVCGLEPKSAKGLSSQPTLSRFENGVRGKSLRQIRQGLEDSYVRELPSNTTVVILDVDTTSDPTHGQQQLSFFNAHYDTHMYHPFLVFDGHSGQLISALLQPGNAGAARCAPPILSRIIRRIKARFPSAQIVVRGDSAFSTPAVLQNLEALNEQFGQVYYLIGFSKNVRLDRLSEATIYRAKDQYAYHKTTQRAYDLLQYRTKSWKNDRTIVIRAETGALGNNPRYLVTNIDQVSASELYRAYCERGECENRIKDLKNALEADRLSCSDFLANYFRLLLHCAAYRLMFSLREIVCAIEPDQPRPQMDTLRIRLLKVGTIVKETFRKIAVRLSAAFVCADLFSKVSAAITESVSIAAPA